MTRNHCFFILAATGLLPLMTWVIAASDAAALALSVEHAGRTVEDGGTGPYKALMVSEKSLATHTVFRPKDLSTFGETAKMPVVAWGNGACANSPWEHVNFLSEVASHGFLVVAIGTMPVGSANVIAEQQGREQV